jgi:hypothetical protein
MTTTDNRRCIRCGEPERDEDAQARFELEWALSEDDPERRSRACWEDAARLNWLYEVEGGLACWGCLTLVEQRREESQCERCGTEYDGCDDVGWIDDYSPRLLLCPDCITGEEDEADTARLLALVEEGKRHCAAEGEEYPADLAALGTTEAARLERRRQHNAAVSRQLAAVDEEK